MGLWSKRTGQRYRKRRDVRDQIDRMRERYVDNPRMNKAYKIAQEYTRNIIRAQEENASRASENDRWGDMTLKQQADYRNMMRNSWVGRNVYAPTAAKGSSNG